jgi:P-type conjugative transfer protein TrbJ
MRRSLARRTCLVSAFAVATSAALTPRCAQAQFGGDIVILGTILAELIKQTADMFTQISLLRQALSRLDGLSFDTLRGLLVDTQPGYDALVQNVDSIGYRLDAINRSFRKVFPSTSDLKSVRYSDFEPLVARWQDEIQASALVAARAQSNITWLKQRSDQAADILSRSASAEGQVAQLQAVVQMLGVMQAQTVGMAKSIDAAGRVTTNLAAASAAEKQLSRERKRRNLANYTFRGAPVTVLKKLP